MINAIMKLFVKKSEQSGEQQKTKDTSIHSVEEVDNKESNSNQLIERYEVSDTPFTIMRQEQDWFVLMGKYRLSASLSSKLEAMVFAKEMDWNRIMQVIGVMIEEYQNLSEIRGRLDVLEKTLNIKQEEFLEREVGAQ